MPGGFSSDNDQKNAATLAPAQQSRIWTLWAGFAGLLVIMCVMAVDAAWSVHALSRTAAALRKQARERDQIVDRLRGEILHSDATLRDYLTELDSARVRAHLLELDFVRSGIEKDLQAYAAIAPVAELRSITELEDGVRSYLKVLGVATTWDSQTRSEQAGAFLQSVVIPNRARLVRLIDDMTELNQRDLDASEQLVDGLHARFGQRVMIMCSVALVFGAGLAILVMRRVNWLERESAARYAEVEQARGNLARLSELLVNAQEEERRKIARELHDGVGQALSATLVEVNRLEPVRLDGAAYSERAGSVRKSLEQCVGLIRDMALLLRPSMLDDLGLTAAIRWQIREVRRRSTLDVSLTADESVDDLPETHRTCVYRCVQEALNNCVRHARASRVRVSLLRDEAGLAITVQDDGGGFDPAREKGLGLLGMKERIERLNGALSIRSASGRGTTVSIRIPPPAVNAAAV